MVMILLLTWGRMKRKQPQRTITVARHRGMNHRNKAAVPTAQSSLLVKALGMLLRIQPR